MDLTSKGNKVFAQVYEEFKSYHLSDGPASENDIERAFLNELVNSLAHIFSEKALMKKALEEIDKIR